MLSKYRKYILYFLILMYVSGSIGFVFNPDFFAAFTPFTLLFTCFVFLIYQPITKINYTVSFIGVALIGYIAEVVGVKTGYVFGFYNYGSALGLKVLKVPLIISLNWALLISSAILVCTYVSAQNWVIALLAALLVTGIDVLIEQVAPMLDFWEFKSGIAEIHNYIGWFVISFIASLLFANALKKGNRKTGLVILALQLLFFGTIYFFH